MQIAAMQYRNNLTGIPDVQHMVYAGRVYGCSTRRTGGIQSVSNTYTAGQVDGAVCVTCDIAHAEIRAETVYRLCRLRSCACESHA